MTSQNSATEAVAAELADQRVARGAALLDRALPGWAQLIDLGRLDLSSETTCVLGQLFEGRLEEEEMVGAACDSNFLVGTYVLGLGTTECVRLGFDRHPEGSAPNYRDLDDAWERAVKDRHDAGFPASSSVVGESSSSEASS